MSAKPDLASMANALRALAMDAVEQANSGHPGMPMGMADVATVLFTRYLRYDAAAPDWPDRDRFVLSAGHGSMLLYGLLHLAGYPGMDMHEIERFRQLGSATPGHPEYGHSPGVETTTGPLGQGIATAVGMGIAERAMNAAFDDGLVDHRCWVVASDGDMMEGVSHEAAALAGHLRLGRLIVLYDDNGISIDGPTALAMSDDPARRFEACGWHTIACDGHDPDDIARAIDAALADPRPSLVSCRTTIALGAPTKAGTAASHGAPLGADEVAAAREALGWSYAPFIVPNDIASAWRDAGAQGRAAREAWQERLEARADRAEFERRASGALPAGFEAAMAEYKAGLLADPPKLATRQSSQRALGAVNAALPETIGGSADLTGSNGTLTPGLEPWNAENYGGRYLHYGVREHGMAAAMNGMALHGGVIPYGATFLTFTDYCRPSIRLAALMGIRSIFVMTHDSIGLGEDGPTHQPIEHLASLRAMPGLVTMRPADAMETAECWEVALSLKGPSVLALTRQGVPAVRTEPAAENLSARGAYVLADCGDEPAAVLIATGSEVGIAMEAKAALDASGVPARVVSMPSMELFERQDAAYRANVLPEGPVRVAVEAAASFGWDRHVGPGGAVVGIDGFGASAPAPALYEHFGITAERVVEEVRARLG